MEEETVCDGITCSSSSESSAPAAAAVTVLKRRCDAKSTEASVKFKKAKFAGQVKGCRASYKLNEDRDNRAECGVQSVNNLEIYNESYKTVYSAQHNTEASDNKLVEELPKKSECYDGPNPSSGSFSFMKYQTITDNEPSAQSTIVDHKHDADDFSGSSYNDRQNVSLPNKTFKNHQDEVSHISYCGRSNTNVVENCSFSQSSTSSSNSSLSMFGRQSFQPVRHQRSLPGSSSSLRTHAQEMPQLRTLNFHNTAGHEEIDRLELWQNQLTAKAIVDNAINKTLEEMGISPDTEANMLAAERTAVEDQGISAAINSQGLVTARFANQAPFSSELWSHISEFSEAVLRYNRLFSRSQNFSADVRQRLHSGDHISRPLDGLTPSVESDTSTQNTDFIDQAVAMAISSQGLSVRRASL